MKLAVLFREVSCTCEMAGNSLSPWPVSEGVEETRTQLTTEIDANTKSGAMNNSGCGFPLVGEGDTSVVVPVEEWQE